MIRRSFLKIISQISLLLVYQKLQADHEFQKSSDLVPVIVIDKIKNKPIAIAAAPLLSGPLCG